MISSSAARVIAPPVAPPIAPPVAPPQAAPPALVARPSSSSPLAPSSHAQCAHCGTSADDPSVLAADAEAAADAAAGDAPWYCCAGCRTVAEALAQGGLTEWYELAGNSRAPAHTTARRYDELDDPAFASKHVERGEDGLARTQLYLEDLRCTACVWLVEQLPQLTPGVTAARVDLGRGLAELTFDPQRVALSTIGRALDRLGHPAHPYRDVDRDAQRRREDRALLIKIGVAGAAAGNVMLLAIALYAGWLGGAMTGEEETFLRWVSMVVSLPAMGYAATPFFRTAVASLRARRLHLDLPITVGIVAGLGWGAANVVRGTGEIYFDSVGTLVFLLLISRFVQARHQRKASVAAEMLLALTPRRARLVLSEGRTSEKFLEVPVEAIVPGQLVEVRPGETIPLDGVLERGATTIDRGLLTGESEPALVSPGDRLYAGTVNLSAPIQLRAHTTGEATRLGQLVARVAELARRRAPVERFVDGVAGRFTAVVATTALFTALGWALAGHPGAGLEHAMALLVVTCPCALALATPLALSIALSRAARRGILIKGAEVLEQLERPGVLVLDKTGTLTLGAQRVVSFLGPAEVAALASAVEARSVHPVARALAAHARPAPGEVSELRETFGRGVAGTLDGRRVAVGSPRWISEIATVPLDLSFALADVRRRGESPVMIAVDGVAVAVAGLADPLRPDAAAAIAALRRLGWQVELLSGDDAAIVRRTGQSLGLPAEHCRGGVAPEEKAARIEALVAARRDDADDGDQVGPVVMVGDGINDAAALAAASCGIAMHGSAEASIEAADIYVSRPGVAALVDLFAASRATMATIRRNLGISLFYNLTSATLAVTGVIHPLIAAVLMPLSSLTVLASSLRSSAMRTRAATAPPSEPSP
jgi:P-type Cu2+ transporter